MRRSAIFLVLGLLGLLQVAGAFSVGPAGAAPVLSAAQFGTRGVGRLAELPRTPAAPLMMAEKELNPVAAIAAGGGSLGIFYAAFCTSTGSPPTGLLVAFFAVLFMTAGATIAESGGLPPRE